MAKTKEQKTKLLEGLDDKIQRMKSAVIIDYKGLKVKDTETLRNNLREKGVEFNVSKNTITKIALKKNGIEFDESVFKKPVAIAFAMEDEVTPAREITLFAKTNEALEILGGILEKKYIDEAMVRRLAALPSREQLLGQVVGTIAAPLSGMVNVLAGNIRNLVNVLNNYKNQQVSE
jgi:large subunit ribosomal protein L10